MAIYCPKCKVKGRHIHGQFFECPRCGHEMWDKEEGKRLKLLAQKELTCPICEELTSGLGGDLSGLENIHPYKDPSSGKTKQRFFHPCCYKEYLLKNNLEELLLQMEIQFLEAVSNLPCPHCNSTSITVEPANPYIDLDTYDPYTDDHWFCLNCEKTIDLDLILSHIKLDPLTTK